MTALPQPDELTRKLRSLSIVRSAEEMRTAPIAQADAAPKTGPKTGRGKLPAALALVVLAGTAAWYWQGDLRVVLAAGPDTTVAAAVASNPAPTVRPAAATETPPPPSPAAAAARLVGSGHVLAGRESIIGTDVGGRLTEMLVAVGDTVRAGQPIAQFDDTEARMTLDTAELALEAARADADRLGILRDQAAARAARLQSLAARGAAPTTNANDAGFELRLAEAQVTAAQLSVRKLGVDRDRARERLDRLTVTAPFDGIVVETRAVAGDLIGSALEGGPVPAIAVLMDPASLRVEADLAETALSQVTVGQQAEVTLDAWPQARLQARVAAILPRASLQKGTITLRLELTEKPNDVALLANMAAKIALIP